MAIVRNRARPYAILRGPSARWIWTSRGWVLGMGAPRRVGVGVDCPDGYVDDGAGTCVAQASSGGTTYTPGAPPPSPPGYSPSPVPVTPPTPTPGTPGAPAAAPTTGMSTTEIVAIGAAAVAAVGLIGYAVHTQRKPGSKARRAVAHVRRRIRR